MRKFLYLDDMAEACVHLMDLDQAIYAAHTQAMLAHINVCTGVDLSIRERAETISKVGYARRTNSIQPSLTARREDILDVSRLCSWLAQG